MKDIQWRDLFFVALQLLLFALFFINRRIFDFDRPNLLYIELTAIVVIIAGVVISVLGMVYLNNNLTPFPTPKKEAELILTGIYQYIRHPIYSGLLLAMLAYSVYTYSIERVFYTAIMFVVFYYKSRLEERLLLEKFKHYGDYMKRTGRFIPKRLGR